MATRAECQRALAIHEDALTALPEVVGLGIVRAEETGSPAALAVGLYVRRRAPDADYPSRLEIPDGSTSEGVPVRVIPQGPVVLEPGEAPGEGPGEGRDLA